MNIAYLLRFFYGFYPQAFSLILQNAAKALLVMLVDAWKIYTYQIVESTMDQAVQLIDLEDQFAVIAYDQTKGRGRYDRRWFSSGGSFYYARI